MTRTLFDNLNSSYQVIEKSCEILYERKLENKNELHFMLLFFLYVSYVERREPRNTVTIYSTTHILL